MIPNIASKAAVIAVLRISEPMIGPTLSVLSTLKSEAGKLPRNFSITRLSKPRTTAEEVRAYKEIIAANSWKRVGVCSSAWHLRRVEKICRSEGVEMIPVPADFLSASLPWTPMYAVPQARGFQNVQKAIWEYLGSIAGG